MTWGIVTKIGLLLICSAAVGTAPCQNSNSQDSALNLKPDLRGKSIFETRCATCHGLDGLGGEHAPDIARQAAVNSLSDRALLDLIHDGIPEAGMPGFPELGKEGSEALVAHLRFLQGKSAGSAMAGNPDRGRDVFFGKSGCSTCHLRGQSMSDELTGFARDHEIGEIREAIVKPPRGRTDAATAVARDGRKFSGMIRNEDNASLQLQDESGRFYLLMKSSLVSVQRETGKVMPADYGQRLSATELNDLVGYILREAHASGSESGRVEEEAEPHARH